MEKTISVALATYNGSRYLRQQLDSLYAQIRRPDEVVVSDDGSTDGTLDILEEYHKNYNLHYSINPGPHGVNNNFYRAISLCTMDYIAICDQDDIWLPEKIDVSYRKLLEIDRDLPCAVSSLCNHIDASGKIIKFSTKAKDRNDYAATLLEQGRSQGCSLMFNRKLWNYVSNNVLVDTRVNSIYDAVISYTAAIVGIKYNLGDRLMLYRHHESNVIAKQGKKKDLKQRIIEHEYYYLPFQRFSQYEVFYDICKRDISDPRIDNFLKRSIRIRKENHLKGFIDVFQMPELSLLKKFSIVIMTSGLDIIKLLFDAKGQ